ncbi:HD domain-containing protein [Lanmaoa asiatica]|nr:HD domain-containing protein [Lanmaoa asiatica]
MSRTFPPLYQPTGDADTDRLAFFHVLERLKRGTSRSVRMRRVCAHFHRSISDHMYRMAVLAMCTSDPALDVSKCVMMCVVHDLAEAQVGDITPREGISKEEKRRLEAVGPHRSRSAARTQIQQQEAMHNFVHDMLHATPAALRMEALWKEYEEGETPEAKFVKGTYSHLDRLEMALQGTSSSPTLFWEGGVRANVTIHPLSPQAHEYEKAHRRDRGDLQGFFDSSLPYLRHPEVRHWGDTLALARESDLDVGGRGGA